MTLRRCHTFYGRNETGQKVDIKIISLKMKKKEEDNDIKNGALTVLINVSTWSMLYTTYT